MEKITNSKQQTTDNLQIPMANKFSVIWIWVLCIVCNLGFVYWNLDVANAGSVQFSTYYPAPFGMYDRLRLVPRADLSGAGACDPGTLYIDDVTNEVMLCDAAGNWGTLNSNIWTKIAGAGGDIYATDTTANVGIGTTTPEFKLTLDKDAASPDGGILAIGTFGSGATLGATSGAGTRLIWFPRKAAFRSGRVGGAQWNDANIGNHSVAMGRNTTASGDTSTALGLNTTANSNNSTAMGYLSTASNVDSTAMGNSTQASGLVSTAMGSSTTASGDVSTAMGIWTTASGLGSMATGSNTTASGDVSTAMGIGTTAQAYASVVLGQYNVIAGDAATWVATDPLFVIGNGADAGSPSNAMTVLKNGNTGIGTTAPEFKLTLDKDAASPDGGILAIGTFGSGATLGATSGAGTRLIWFPRKAAFRAGRVNSVQWNDANIGEYSVAMGGNTGASGQYSTAMGSSTTASGSGSTAMGSGAVASGRGSTAMGSGTTASGTVSTAMGGSTTASGQYSTAMGGPVIGWLTTTTASGSGSTAMGGSTTASGQYSTAMGDRTTASDSGSTAMGGLTTASGQYSTAMGLYTTAQAYASVVLGRYNVIAGNTGLWVAADPLFVIGNGADAGSPSNALTVLKNGNTGIGTAAPLQRLEVNGGIKLNTAAARPACDAAAARGTLWFTRSGVGVADRMEVCAKNALNAYGWRPLF